MEIPRDTTRSRSSQQAVAWHGGMSMMQLWPVLLPELRQFPESERSGALAKARETVLDVTELVAMAVGLVAVTALTKYGVPDLSMASRFGLTLANFAVALPLLVAVLGPFHLRRLRRGLRRQLQHRGHR
jgi:hypothetical protein